jgi:hypothetical protein
MPDEYPLSLRIHSLKVRIEGIKFDIHCLKLGGREQKNAKHIKALEDAIASYQTQIEMLEKEV